MVTLVILDGFGLNDKIEGNAIRLQGTPYLDKLKDYPYTTLCASGEDVGLTPGQMGNSEVGHLNIGAGRVVYQDLSKIQRDIASGEFVNNVSLLKSISHVIENNSTLHIMGLLSNGGVHSHIDHMKEIVQMAHEKGVKNICIHAFMDGRDTLTNSGIKFLKETELFIKGKATIASLCGRVYAMDRENRWDRVKKAYDMLVLSKAENTFSDSISAIQSSYDNGIFDEFVEPVILDGFKPISNNDAVVFFNYRTDRARELTQVLSQKNFDKFERKELSNLLFCCMTEYSCDFEDVLIAYPPEKIEDNLSAVISENGLKQLHITETTKYAHVTFFFNGGIENAYIGEDRKLIDSYNVKNFEEVPQMRAREISDAAIESINSGEYDFVLINLSNPDMIGHTGNIEACKQAIKIVDEYAYKIAEATLGVGGHCIITADHGNAEELLDEKGNVVTSHTTNKVPLWLVSNKYKDVKLKSGKLANIAPTILKIMNLEKPSTMTNDLL